MDRITTEKRSYVMSRVKGKDTLPEILVRRELHQLGFRYRLHATYLPGKPDIVLPKYRVVGFIHGCFWHGHACGRTGIPKTNTLFWKKNFERNKERDFFYFKELKSLGWRVFIVWECAIQGKRKITKG